MRALVLTTLLCSGCYSSMDFSTVDPNAYGSAPTAELLKSTADAHLQGALRDPDSRRVRWFDEEPRHAAMWTGLLGSGWIYGWAMRLGVNAKNGYGGYAGEEPYFVMIAAGKYYVAKQLTGFCIDDSR